MATTQQLVLPGTLHLAILVLTLLAAAIAGCSAAPDGAGRADRRAGSAALPGPRDADTRAVLAVLDDFHDAASKADGPRYFAHFATDASVESGGGASNGANGGGGVFLGTDASERWTVAQFRDYAAPYFSRGRGWTYVPRPESRHVMFPRAAGNAGPAVAWFSELLDNEKYGLCRGTGVLVREGGAWRIAQYDLHFAVPNDAAGAVVEAIRREGATRAGAAASN